MKMSQEELSQIESMVVELYQKNLLFLKENFFDIFQEVEELSIKIASEEYEEQYILEMKDSYFDIKNLKNDGYYYAVNSYIDAEQRALNVDCTNNSSFDLLRKQGSSQKLAMPYGLKEVLPVVDFINNKVDLDNVEFQKIMKFIYIGVGLGYHIQEIDRKIQSYTTLIIEPELEIFRLSLFTTDYSVFHKDGRNLFLSVGDEVMAREKKITNFYNYHKYMNYNIKHYILLKGLDYIKNEIIEYCDHHYAGAFPYSSVIKNVKRTVGFIRDKDRFLIANTILEKKLFEKKQVLLISAGPSLDGYIELIKKYQDKFVIVSVDVIVRKLEKHNIIPDIVFSIDPSHLCAKYLSTENPSYLKDSAIILLSQQHPDVMELLRKRNLNYYFSQFAAINKEIGSLGSVPNVGTFSFYAMLYLGATNLYTIGNDAAFNQETGARYSSDSSHTQTEELDASQRSENLISREDVVEVKGNLRDTVKTNRSLLPFKYSYEVLIDNMKHFDYNVFNLSDGAYIEGLTPMKKEAFTQICKDNIKVDDDIKKLFDSVSKVLEEECYKNDIKILNEIIQRVRKFQKIKIISRDDFLAKKIDMMIWILEKTKDLSIDIFGNIFLDYTNLVDSYINFALNLKQKNFYTRENLELLRNQWTKGVIEVFKDIKDSII